MKIAVLLERIEVAEAALERLNVEELDEVLSGPEIRAVDQAMTHLAVAYARLHTLYHGNTEEGTSR